MTRKKVPAPKSKPPAAKPRNVAPSAKAAKAKPAKQTAPSWIVATQREVSNFFALSRTSMGHWTSAGMPGEPGKYDLSAIAQWRLARAQRRSTSTAGDATDEAEAKEIQQLEKQELREKVRYRRNKNHALTGKLLPKRQTEQAINELVLMVKHRIEAWPDQIEPSLPAETRVENKRDLQQAVRLLLTELSQWKP